MKIALGTIEVTDFQARAVALAMQTRRGGVEYLPRFPRAASRAACREWVLTHGLASLTQAEVDLRYLKDRLDSRSATAWRRGQPELKQVSS
jgi:hypothetical protein